jgi:hypothetical protein
MKTLLNLVLVMIGVCTGCQVREKTMSPNAIEMQSVCIGRHLFALPVGFVPVMPITATFKPEGVDPDETFMNVSVVAAGVSEHGFSNAMRNRRTALMEGAHTETDILKDTVSDKDSTMFRVQRIGDSYTSELHFLKARFHVSAALDSYDDRYSKAEADLFSFEKQVIFSDGAVTSPSTGFCVGPVLVNSHNIQESVNVTFRSEKRPDIIISIEVDTFNQNDPVTLHQRVSGPNSLLNIFDTRHQVLRKRELKVVGIHAQEWLGSVRLGENRDQKQFGFALETMRRTPSYAAPRIVIEMDTGQKDPLGKAHETSLSDEQAMALWDAIVAGIRPREVAK